jgi:hypothetical protein
VVPAYPAMGTGCGVLTHFADAHSLTRDDLPCALLPSIEPRTGNPATARIAVGSLGDSRINLSSKGTPERSFPPPRPRYDAAVSRKSQRLIQMRVV